MAKCAFVFKYVHHFHVFARVHDIEMHSPKKKKTYEVSKKFFYLTDRNNLFNGKKLVIVEAHLQCRSKFTRHCVGKQDDRHLHQHPGTKKKFKMVVSLVMIDGEF